MASFRKGDKILIKSLHECKGYNARQFITEFPGDRKRLDEEQHQQASGKLRKFGTA